MNKTAVLVILAITVYIGWLLLFLFVLERPLRRFAGWLFGVTIKREFYRTIGKPELLDILFVFGWKVTEPASLTRRLAVGTMRVGSWLVAIAVPLVIGFAFLYLEKRS